MKKSLKDQTTTAFQVGGYVAPTVPTNPYSQPGQVNPQTGTYTLPGTGIAGYQVPSGGQTGYTPYGGAAPYFQPVQFAGPQFQTSLQTTNLPTFADTVGSNIGKYDELRTYINDAGQILQIPFKDGKPIYPIPEGYRPKGDQPTAEQPTATIPVSTPITNQGDGGGDGDGTGVAGSVQGPASTATGLSGVQSALSGITGYFSGAPAEAQPYGGTTLGSLNAQGMVSYDSKGNVIGPSVTDFSNNIAGVQDALGVYGTGPINLGIVGSMLMGNPLGALASASGIGPSSEAFGQAAPTGHGAYSTADLNAYARGTMSKAQQNELGISMNQNQAFARAQVQRSIGTPITGIVGYKKGDISPITGTPVNSKGRVVNFQGSTTGVDAGFASMGDWMDALSDAAESGYWGGPKSAKEVGVMTKSQAAKYNDWAEVSGHTIGGEGPATGPGAEAGIAGTPDGGFGPTGRQSSTGRQDYSGGISQDNNNDGGMGFGADDAASGADDAMGDDGIGGGDSVGDSDPDDGDEAYCLTEDMKVKLNGVVDFVTKVQVGDIVDNTVVTEVLHKHMREGYYVVNGELKITNDHPVLANDSWKRTEDLVLGDYINNIEVTSLEYIEQVTPTVYIGTAEDRYDVYTEGEVYTVHGQYKNALKKAA